MTQQEAIRNAVVEFSVPKRKRLETAAILAKFNIRTVATFIETDFFDSTCSFIVTTAGDGKISTDEKARIICENFKVTDFINFKKPENNEQPPANNPGQSAD